jgi:hypothetical protein
MGVRRLTEDDELVPIEPGRQQASPSRSVRPLSEQDEVVSPPTRTQQALNMLGDVNTGIIRPFGPGALGLAERAGVVPEGAAEPAQTVGQGARRMAGESVFMAGAMAYPWLRGNQMTVESQRFLNTIASGSVGISAALREGLRRGAETLARRPGTTLGFETAAGTAAGAAGTSIQLSGGTGTQQLFGELAGGIAGGTGAAGTAAAARIMPVSQYTRTVVSALREGTVEGIAPGRSRERAAARTRRAIDEPAERVIGRADEADVLEGLSLPERAEDMGLLRLERSVFDATEELTRARYEHFTEINQLIARSLRELPGETDATPQDARAYLDGLVATRIEQAVARTQERLTDLGPRVNREQANRLARQEIQRALDAAMEQEADLWSAVPGHLQTGLYRTQNRLHGLLTEVAEDRVRASQRMLPSRVTQMLGRIDPETGEFVPGTLGDTASINEIRSLRDEVRRAAQVERARPAPSGTRLRLLNEINEALLADLNTIDAESGSALDLARGFSRDLNQRFRKDDVGTILGHTAEGSLQTPEGLTLETTLGQAGARARESVDRVLDATGMRLNEVGDTAGDVPAMREHMMDFIRHEFRQAAAPDGEMNLRAAQSYVNRRAELLGRFPELRRQLDAAIEAGDAESLVRQSLDPAKSRASVFLGRDLDQAMTGLVNDSDAARNARLLRELLEEDPTGRALEGGRRALMENIIAKTRTPGGPDAADLPFVSGRQMRDLLRNPRMDAVIQEFLTPRQQDRLRTIANTAVRMDRARAAPPAQEGILGDRPGLIARTGARMVGAVGGRWLARWTGGGTVQMPGLGANLVADLQRKGLDPAQMIVVDAVTRQDDRLFRALMTDVTASPRREEFVRTQLNAWALAVAAEHGVSIAEGEQDDHGSQRGQF